MSIRRTVAAGAAAFALGAFSLVATTGPAQADPQADPLAARTVDPLPPTAVALGDSFISGEGAGNYTAVTDQSGAAQGFPGWSADNHNAYFCHRSPNASISVANLPGITDRVNLACSGAQPADMASASSARTGGRTVASQIEQLRQVGTSHDIDLVLIGLGSNNAHFTFGTVAAECAGRFVGDGYTGWWEVWIDLLNWVNGTKLNQQPCSDADLAGPAQFAGAQADTTAALGQVLDVLDEIDADGQHRIVLQDYTNPLPEAYAAQYLTESGRNDERDKYRALVDERYAAGCPIDVASLAPAHRFSQGLGNMVAGVTDTLRTQRPGSDITYLGVQHAFDGARLCEQGGSPGNSLATPLRVMDGPSGVFVQSFTPFDKLDIKRVTGACSTYYQTCQESWHPSAAGHQVLGQCLSAAWAQGGARLVCSRAPSGDIQVG